MKKVLFATTALVATAGVASADVALSGSAEMGVFSAGSRSITLADDPITGASALIAGGATLEDAAAAQLSFSTSETEAAFHTHVDVTFTLSGTSDNGLTFGASVDLDEADNINGDNEDGVAVFVSGEFGTATMGDTDGAFDWAMSELDLASGSITDAHTAHAGFSGNSGLDGWFDGQILRYDYSMAGFGVALSIELDDGSDEAVYGIGATYSGQVGSGLTLGVGFGYQQTDGSDVILSLTAAEDAGNARSDTLRVTAEGAELWGVSATLAHDSGFSAGLNYSVLEINNLAISAVENTRCCGVAPAPTTLSGSIGSHERTHFGIAFGYEFDAIAVTANWGEVNSSGAADIFDATGYGLAASYDFGGGLSAHVGYGHSDWDQGGSASNWDIGLAMTF